MGICSVVFCAAGNSTTMRAPRSTAVRPCTAAGTFARGGMGFPIYPQPAIATAAAVAKKRRRMKDLV